MKRFRQISIEASEPNDVPEIVRQRLQNLPEAHRERFFRILERLKHTANVKTASAGTQYILPIDILLSPKVLQEMEKLSAAVKTKQAGASHD